MAGRSDWYRVSSSRPSRSDRSDGAVFDPARTIGTDAPASAICPCHCPPRRVSVPSVASAWGAERKRSRKLIVVIGDR